MLAQMFETPPDRLRRTPQFRTEQFRCPPPFFVVAQHQEHVQQFDGIDTLTNESPNIVGEALHRRTISVLPYQTLDRFGYG